jgi:hypothetical protein
VRLLELGNDANSGSYRNDEISDLCIWRQSRFWQKELPSTSMPRMALNVAALLVHRGNQHELSMHRDFVGMHF